jgi:hypothetical protein
MKVSVTAFARTVAGVFHHISPQHGDLYFTETGFRWSQRVVSGQAMRQTRKGRKVAKTLWSRIALVLQLTAAFKSVVGRQLPPRRLRWHPNPQRSGRLWSIKAACSFVQIMF